MIICPRCGFQAPDDSQYCPKCGYGRPIQNSAQPLEHSKIQKTNNQSITNSKEAKNLKLLGIIIVAAIICIAGLAIFFNYHPKSNATIPDMCTYLLPDIEQTAKALNANDKVIPLNYISPDPSSEDRYERQHRCAYRVIHMNSPFTSETVGDFVLFVTRDGGHFGMVSKSKYLDNAERKEAIFDWNAAFLKFIDQSIDPLSAYLRVQQIQANKPYFDENNINVIYKYSEEDGYIWYSIEDSTFFQDY